MSRRPKQRGIWVALKTQTDIFLLEDAAQSGQIVLTETKTARRGSAYGLVKVHVPSESQVHNKKEKRKQIRLPKTSRKQLALRRAPESNRHRI